MEVDKVYFDPKKWVGPAFLSAIINTINFINPHKPFAAAFNPIPSSYPLPFSFGYAIAPAKNRCR